MVCLYTGQELLKTMKKTTNLSKRPRTIPQTKRFDGEEFELLYLELGRGPEGGYATKSQAQKNAREWRESAPDCLARVVKIGDYYYVYGM